MARGELIRSHPILSFLVGFVLVALVALVLLGAIGGQGGDESGVTLGLLPR
jgi:hypothetical protein